MKGPREFLRHSRGDGHLPTAGASLVLFCFRADERVAVCRCAGDTIPFYNKFGFVEHGKEFMDAGLPHKKMKLKLLPG